MARPLDFILEKFPGFKAFPSVDVARELYRRDYGNAKNQFSTEEDYINYLLSEEQAEPQGIDRFGRRITLEQPQTEEATKTEKSETTSEATASVQEEEIPAVEQAKYEAPVLEADQEQVAEDKDTDTGS